MSKEDPTPPRTLRTPQNPPPQPPQDDNRSEEDDAPYIWSDELFPLNIIPFSDNDSYNSDPTYTASEHSSTNESDNDEEEDEETDNEEEVSEEEAAEEADDEDEVTDAEETDDSDDNMADPNPPPPPQVSGGQLSSVTPFSGNQGLDGLVYVEAIDRAREQFGWTQVQTARAAVSRGGCLLYTSPSPRD